MRRIISAAALIAIIALAGCGGSSGTTTPATTIAPPASTTGPAPVTTSKAGLPFVAKLEAPTRTPKVLARWNYRVVVTDPSGSPIAAKLTVQVVDPLHQAHPVDYDGTKKPIVDRPFTGEFRDYVEWPADSRGVPLTLRVTVVAAGARAELTYPVTAR